MRGVVLVVCLEDSQRKGRSATHLRLDAFLSTLSSSSLVLVSVISIVRSFATTSPSPSTIHEFTILNRA